MQNQSTIYKIRRFFCISEYSCIASSQRRQHTASSVEYSRLQNNSILQLTLPIENANRSIGTSRCHVNAGAASLPQKVNAARSVWHIQSKQNLLREKCLKISLSAFGIVDFAYATKNRRQLLITVIIIIIASKTSSRQNETSFYRLIDSNDYSLCRWTFLFSIQLRSQKSTKFLNIYLAAEKSLSPFDWLRLRYRNFHERRISLRLFVILFKLQVAMETIQNADTYTHGAFDKWAQVNVCTCQWPSREIEFWCPFDFLRNWKLGDYISALFMYRSSEFTKTKSIRMLSNVTPCITCAVFFP